ncbi:MAG: ABC transporter substrate-binding protein [Treponema sp.]|jgi:iron complex transport system substrate-binding protein|nr:ABC transporter substrate-binding protein [Treponema sp.]
MKNVKLVIIVLTLALSIFGCKAEGRKIIDRSGRTVVIKGEINRIVSTAPSNTEIIADLGQARKLVAIDKHSANIAGLPANLPLLDFFYPDAEVIINLEPDIIIASGHNPTGTGEDPFRLLREMGIPVVYISMSKSIDEIYKDIAFIAEILQAGKEGENLINLMKAQVSEISLRTSQIESRKTVYFEISAAPDMMSFGKDSFIDDMISVIGARNIFGDEDWLVMLSAEAVINRNPDVILTNVNYIDDPIGEIKSRPGFNHINAIINDRIYQIDNDSSVRPSSRIVFALRQMSEAVYPELYSPDHSGSGVVR